MLVSLPSLSNIAGYNMTRAIRKKSGTGVKTNWHFVWSCSEIDKIHKELTLCENVQIKDMNENKITMFLTTIPIK